MERKKQASLLTWCLVAGLLSQNLIIPALSAASVEDQKNYYYPPDPNAGTPPAVSHHSPPPHGTTPSIPPYHGTPPHGSGGGTPPTNCGNPPSGHYDPSPTPPTGGGGHSHSPPTYGGSPPTHTPTTPSTPTIISPPTTPYVTPSTPSTPTIRSPPTTPSIDPGTPFPGISVPSPPFNPNSPPFGGTCNYWRTHPGLIWGLFGWWGTTVAGAFGVSSVPGFGAHLSLQQALTNTRSDSLGSLYREGTASLLNSMVNRRFPFTTIQVRDNFISALSSNKAAAAQARVFKLANEGRLKPRD